MAITDITKPMALDETLQGTNTKMDAVILKLQGIIDALGLDTSVYKPKGNITCAALVPALLIDDNLGNVYNVTDNGTTTSDFVEGAGKPIHVGDNVAIVDVGTGGQSEYKFDLLAGMVDLTNYVQKSQTAGLLKNDGTVDETEYATADDLEGVSDDVDAIEERMDADTTSISGNPISISGLKANQLARNPIITLEPIQAGSGTPSPSNIRAISGYDKVEALSCGKNLFDGTYSATDKYLNSSGSEVGGTFNISQYIRVKANTAYYFSNLSGATSACICWYNNAKEFISATAISGTGFTATSPSNACYLRASIRNDRTNVCINEGDTAITYIPYIKATSISESLGQTVYKGSLDVRTGLFTVTHAYVDLGSLTWTYNSSVTTFIASDLPNYAKINGNANPPDIVCSQYDKIRPNGYNAGQNNTISLGNTDPSIYVWIKDSRYTDATTFGNAMSGVQLVYKLATPFTIQLTPYEISLLKDYVYVSTNGTNISLDYHNGELASLSDVAQLSETVERLTEYIKGLINNA